MNKAEERRPTYALTEAETIFYNIIRHPKYEDSKNLSKNFVKVKLEFIKKNLDRFEDKIHQMLILDSRATIRRKMSAFESQKSAFGGQDNLSKLSQKILSGNRNKDSHSLNQQNQNNNKNKDSKSQNYSLSANKNLFKFSDAKESNKVQVLEDGRSLASVMEMDLKKRKRGKSKAKKKAAKNSNKQNLIYIDNETGQFIQKGEPMPGMNIFNDLNYGDMIFVFINTLYDFMLDEKIRIENMIRLLDKAEKRRGKPLGLLDKKEVEKMRMKEEERNLEIEVKRREEKEKIMESLGFVFTKEMIAEKKKSPSQNIILKTEQAESASEKVEVPEGVDPENVPFHPKYGRGEDAEDYEMNLEEAFEMFNKYINVISDLKQLNKYCFFILIIFFRDYLVNEQIAFLNALLFYSKQNYYRPYVYRGEEYCVYHETKYSQKPFTRHCLPVFKKIFLEEKNLDYLFKHSQIHENDKKSKNN